MTHADPSSHDCRHPPLPRRRRGVAVILALVAVSVATLLGLSVASTRDATVATSGNLARVSASRAAAASGIELAAAMLAREGAFDGMTGNVLFDGVELNGSRLRAEVVDLETGGPADESTRAYEVVVRSEHDGLIERARAVGRAPVTDAPMHADLDCSEFAVLSTGSLAIEGNAHVGNWSRSPLSALAEPVRIGSSKGRAADLAVSEDASVHGCVELRRGDFAVAGDSDAHDELLADRICPLPAEIHVPAAPAPTPPRRVEAVASLLLDGLVGSSMASSGDARVPARGSVTVRGTVTVDVGGNLFVERGSRMFVENALVLVVRGNTVIDAGSIEVAPEGSLTLIAMGDLTLSGAFVGGSRTDPGEGRDASGYAGYDGGAARTMLFASDDRRVLIADGSVVKGQIYGPSARIDIESRSAVYGRLLGRDIVLHEGVALYYDPALDNRRGWTNPDSGIWSAEATPRPEVYEVPRLDDASMLELAERTNIEPDVPSQAQAAVVLSEVQPLATGYNARIELALTQTEREARHVLRSRLLERIGVIKRRWLERLNDSGDFGGTVFIKLGFQSGGGDD